MDLIGDLELMQALARLGSFSAVGREEGHAPSSIARRLDRLEAHVGVRLFNRTPAGLHLTATGTRKLGEARALTSAAAAFAESDEKDGALSGHIVVSAPSRLGEVCVTQAVTSFLAAHPAVSIDLHLTDEIQDLDRAEIDLAVRIGPTPQEHHVVSRIADNTRVLVASPSYLDARGPIRSVQDLDKCDGLLLGNASSWRLRRKDGAEHLAKPRARVRCISGDAITAMCIAGLGVGLKSAWDVQSPVSNGRLFALLPDWTQADPSDVMIVMPDRRLISPTLRRFRDVLKVELKTRLAT